jgi:hypothetical protein
MGSPQSTEQRYLFHADAFTTEQALIGNRRTALGLGGRPTCPQECVGLALSGGGIRSATFSFGVLQSLARREMLQKVDYLSTVSGGGYIGCYFGSLFLPEALRQTRPDALEPAADAGALTRNDFDKACLGAYATVARSGVPGELEDSPGVGSTLLRGSKEEKKGARSDWTPGGSINWLRDNGRYLAPRGTGDLIYAAAMQIRNWAAVQYVVGMVIVAVLLVFAALRAWMIAKFEWWRSIEAAFLPGTGASIYWSPGWALVAAYALLFVLPPGIAYWLVHSRVKAKRALSWLPLWHEIAVLFGTVMALLWAYSIFKVRVASGNLEHPFSDLPVAFWVAAGYVLTSLLALGVFFAGLCKEKLVRARNLPLDLKSLRTRFTGWLRWTFQGFLFAAGSAVLGTLGQTLYAYIHTSLQGGLSGFGSLLAGSTTLSALLVTGARQLFKALGSSEKARTTRIPLDLLAGLGAILLLLLTGAIWAVLVQAALWTGGPPPAVPAEFSSSDLREWSHAAEIHVSAWLWPGSERAVDLARHGLPVLAGASVHLATGWMTLLLVAVAFLFITTGTFLNFLNLSSLHQLYAARLTRAYLGATNRARFKDGKVVAVTTPLPTDTVAMRAYYSEQLAAPVHLINTTVNQTRPSATQLVQRDRKGVSMAIGPGYTVVNRAVFRRSDADGTLEPANAEAAALAGQGDSNAPWKPFASEKLDLGDWCSISGAAFSTGLGSKTSLGLSLLAGLANVRLGYWWNANIDQPDPLRWFATYRYLWNELMANFEGPVPSFWFLTDGGHFDNTGIYELVRRRVGIIILCDDGCDPDYRFEDLGNLARKIRMDFGAEMVDLSGEAATMFEAGSRQAACFGSASDFADAEKRTAKCALLYAIRYPESPGDRSLLIVLKPNMIPGVPIDVAQYKWANDDFPNQTTLDQFFDDAQWESYRKLGEVIASTALDPGAVRFEGWRKKLLV